MAEYFIQQKAFRSNARTLVYDEKEHTLYLLVASNSENITLYDLNGTILGSIKQASKFVKNRFVLYQNYQKMATLQKVPYLKKDHYFLSKFNWLASGDFAKHRYQIKHRKNIIMEVHTTYLFNGTFYSLSIPEDKNIIPAILTAAALDYWITNVSHIKQKRPHFKPAWG